MLGLVVKMWIVVGLLWDCVELWFGKWGKVWKNMDRILQKDYNDTNYIVV